MANILRTVIQFRRAHTEEWLEHKDVIPAAGEPCYDLDLHTLKIGDGNLTYEQLPVIGGVSVNVSADGKSVEFKDGVLKLLGFESAAAGAYPVKMQDGTLGWAMPSTDDLESLRTEVTNLKTEVTNVQNIVTTIQEIVSPSGEDAVPLLDRVETLEDKIGVLNGNESVDGSVLKIVKDEINAFANQINDDGTVNTIKELFNYVANHGGEVETIIADILALQNKVGEDSVKDQIDSAIKNSGHMSKAEAEATLLSKVEASATFEKVKYEICHTPVGTLVDYRDKEIRVMCPADTQFALQNVGATGDASKYYIGFKAYAPAGAVSFKEDTAEVISDNTMYYFDGNDFAGTDAYGRKYSICWLAVANYVDGVWTYYGAKSNASKYIGWYYSVEWYDANGKKIASDCIRINLSNETCHNNVEPFYMANVVKEVAVNGTVIDVVNGRVDISIDDTVSVKGSDEIEVAEDGTLTIKTIPLSKLVGEEGSEIVLDGGGAAKN